MVAVATVTRAVRGLPWALVWLISCDEVLGLDSPTPRPDCVDPTCSDGGGGGGDDPALGGTGGGNTGNGGSVGDTGGDGGTGDVGECTDESLRCNAYQPQRCIAGAWSDVGDECTGYCQDGTCKEARSCDSSTTTAPCVGGTSCCDTIWIPGGTYEMGKGDDELPDLSYSRKVSGFYLDRFEVTVGRFTAFVSNYRLPAEGDGGHPLIPMSGWQKSWEGLPDYDHDGETAVPPTSAALEKQVSDADYCGQSTYDAGMQTLPINCVNWYVAFAFCIFDGGRLPTEAEWNYAAAFGDAHRPYPWSQSVSDLTVDPSLATYYSEGTPLDLPSPVGSHEGRGQGGFHRNPDQGHEDLGGNIFEWTADQWTDEPEASCPEDCMALWSETDDARIVRGGAFPVPPNYMRSGKRVSAPAGVIRPLYGFRCARDFATE